MFGGFEPLCSGDLFSGSRSGLSGVLIAMLGVALYLVWSKNIWQRVDKAALILTVIAICLVSGYGLWINLWGRVEMMAIRLAVWEGVW